MDKKIREAIALLRHQIISPVLMESEREQNKYFRKLEKKNFEVPGVGLRGFKVSTMKGWLRLYKEQGFAGLVPKVRTDRGTNRKLSEFEVGRILRQYQEWPQLRVSQFHKHCRKENLLGQPPICEQSLRNLLKAEGFSTKRTPKPRRRFEMDYFGQMWVGDFMHGPTVLRDGDLGKRRKAILFAFMDDHSRLITAAEFNFQENTLVLEKVFKEAVLRFGLPEKIYVDNGPSFSSRYLAVACAHLGVALVHSKPYDSASRGKIERFWRTVRDTFLAHLRPDGLTLADLNRHFQVWLREKYHHQLHRGIGCRPVDRYRISIKNRPLKYVDESRLEEFFLFTLLRHVNKDSTISLNGIIYEVPSHLIGQRIEVRHPQDRPREVYLYEQDLRVMKLKPVDARANAKTYRPSPRDSVIPFQNINKPGEKND
jgi:putative transposase